MAVLAWFEKTERFAHHSDALPLNDDAMPRSLDGQSQSEHTNTNTDRTEKDAQIDTSHSIRREKITECDEYLQKAVKWEGYVLDARVGMKLSTAVETLNVYKREWNL